jgi:hypothetical protein
VKRLDERESLSRALEARTESSRTFGARINNDMRSRGFTSGYLLIAAPRRKREQISRPPSRMPDNPIDRDQP